MKASGIYEKRAQPPAKSFGQLQGSLSLPAGRSSASLVQFARAPLPAEKRLRVREKPAKTGGSKEHFTSYLFH